MIRIIISIFFVLLHHRSVQSENCLHRMLHDLNITHCGWETDKPPTRIGNEVFGFDGVYNFTETLHIIHGKYNIKYVVRKDNEYIGETLEELGAWEDAFQFKVLNLMNKMNRTYWI